MKIATLFLLLLSSLIIHANDSKKTNTQIQEVTVYLNGAQIKRTALVNLKPGQNEIILNDLSSKIDQNSIQVSGLKDISILSINYNIDYLEKKESSEQLKFLKDQLKDLHKEKNHLENLLTGYIQEKTLLEKNQHINSGETGISLEKIKQISSYYRQRSVEIQDQTYMNQKQIEELDSKITDVSNEINKLSDNSQDLRGEITLKLDAQTTTNLALEIRYNVTDAGWFPLYDIKSKSTNQPLNIAYKANVYQQTGTDWENVNVILSTGDPNTNNSKPNLNPKYLNFSNGNYKSNYVTRRNSYTYNPTIKSITGIVTDQNGVPLPGANVIEKGTNNGVITDFDGRYIMNVQNGRELQYSYIGYNTQNLPVYSSSMNVKLATNNNELEEVVVIGYGSKREEKEEREEKHKAPTLTTKEQGLTNTQFKIKKKYSIDSKAEVTVIEIDNFDIKADYQHYLAPELNENVFLTAKLGNWEKFNLLSGEANIYFEGNYAGKTNIDPLATTDSLTVSLGVDPNITVLRKQLDNFKSKSFIGGTKIIDRGYQIEVKNNKQTTIDLILEDRIPISQNKEIKIDNIKTADALFDIKTGIMKWKLTLKSNDKTVKQFSYQVKYPKNKRINL